VEKDTCVLAGVFASGLDGPVLSLGGTEGCGGWGGGVMPDFGPDVVVVGVVGVVTALLFPPGPRSSTAIKRPPK